VFVGWAVLTTTGSTGGKSVVVEVPRLDLFGATNAWVFIAAAAVPVINTAAKAKEVPNFVFMSQK
jgi:hypothetical protein